MKYLIEKTLNRILKERGIKLNNMCREVGISSSLFSQSMKYKRKLKSTELISICFYLGIDLNTFKNLEI